MHSRPSRLLTAIEDPALSARVVAEHPLRGVGAGSALLQIGERLLAVHDDAFRVSWIALPSLDVRPLILAGDGAALPKATKPDFEAAVYTANDRTLHLLGSGSTAARCTIARVELDSGAVTMTERPDLYRSVQEAMALDDRPNIEGALIDDGCLVLFHRGVGGAPSTRLALRVDVLDGGAPTPIAPCESVALGSLDGVPLGITDAVGSLQRTIFVAAAEDTGDAYVDGAVTGSVLGMFERGLVRFARVRNADGTPFLGKLEGLAVDRESAAAWALTDADDPQLPTNLCRLDLEGFAT